MIFDIRSRLAVGNTIEVIANLTQRYRHISFADMTTMQGMVASTSPHYRPPIVGDKVEKLPDRWIFPPRANKHSQAKDFIYLRVPVDYQASHWAVDSHPLLVIHIRQQYAWDYINQTPHRFVLPDAMLQLGKFYQKKGFVVCVLGLTSSTETPFGVHNMTRWPGRTILDDFCLVEQADVMVGCDSGMWVYAAACGTPVAMVNFCQPDPKYWGWIPGKHFVVHKKVMNDNGDTLDYLDVLEKWGKKAYGPHIEQAGFRVVDNSFSQLVEAVEALL